MVEHVVCQGWYKLVILRKVFNMSVNVCFEQNVKKIKNFPMKFSVVASEKNLCILHGQLFMMNFMIANADFVSRHCVLEESQDSSRLFVGKYQSNHRARKVTVKPLIQTNTYRSMVHNIRYHYENLPKIFFSSKN